MRSPNKDHKKEKSDQDDVENTNIEKNAAEAKKGIKEKSKKKEKM